MKYEVILTEEALDEFYCLEKNLQKKVQEDYNLIYDFDISSVITKPLGKKIFEIKTDNVRSLFKYQKDRIIIIGLIFLKKTQKTPKEILKLAKKRLEKY